MSKDELFTKEQVIEALKLTGGLHTFAAQKLGCAPSTITLYKKRYPEIAEAVVDIRAATLDIAESHFLKGVNDGDKGYVMFCLKTLGRHRGFIERGEITGPEGGPVQVQAKPMDYTVYTSDELRAMEKIQLDVAARARQITRDRSESTGGNQINSEGAV